MKKSDLVAKVVSVAGLTKKQAAAVVDEMLEAIAVALQNGEKVQIAGFGNFQVRRRAARQGKHPITKEPIMIAARTALAFRAAKQLKERVTK